MIQVEHLTKQYGPKTAIADVSFSVEKGEVLAFLGPNGAGKTTTMRILTASMPATSGSARVAGYDCFDHPSDVKRAIVRGIPQGLTPFLPPRGRLRIIAQAESLYRQCVTSPEPDIAPCCPRIGCF